MDTEPKAQGAQRHTEFKDDNKTNNIWTYEWQLGALHWAFVESLGLGVILALS